MQSTYHAYQCMSSARARIVSLGLRKIEELYHNLYNVQVRNETWEFS